MQANHESWSSEVVLAIKAVAWVPATIFTGLVAATSEGPVYVAVGSVIIGLAGLFLRQFFQNQAATWRIAEERRRDNEDLRDELHFKDWENAHLRYRLGERGDPGPYRPRPRSDRPAIVNIEENES